MTDTSTIASTATLPAAWTPTGSGCLQTNDFWRWYWSNDDGRTVVGGPSQVTNCFPPTWDPTANYEGSGCPPQYTSACQGSEENAATTCCPNLYYLTCVATSAVRASTNHAASFRCVSQFATANPSMVITVTDLTANTLASTTGILVSRHLYALGIVYTTKALASTSTAGPSRSTSGPASGQTGDPGSDLSTGAIAGIGVGAGIGIILLAALGWFFFMRRRVRKRSSAGPNLSLQQADEAESLHKGTLASPGQNGNATPSAAGLMHQSGGLPTPEQAASEMEGSQPARAELGT